MKNFIQPGVNLTLPAPYNLISGDPAKVGEIFGVASQDAPIGNNVDLVTEGVFTLTKVSANAFTLGQKAYWDDAARLITTTASGNSLIGVAVEATTAGNATVAVKLYA
jgi:predicted RecA/RadA family phage recombinase